MNVVDSLVEVTLKAPEDFLKVKETLTRIGVASKKDNTLYQSCHILHKQQRYYIVHFKELFALDGKPSNIDQNDIQRRNTITSLLDQWGLLTVVKPEAIEDTLENISQVKIVSHKDKKDWNLVAKYTIGKKKDTPKA